jgi:2-dehydropantoate 2-reductase
VTLRYGSYDLHHVADPIVPQDNRMRADFTILGAGAIGSILGAHLTHAGHAVAMISRGNRARQIAREGLRICGLVDLRTSVRVIENATELEHAGVLIVATKALGTAALLAPMAHVDLDAAFSIQNGIQKNDILANIFGRGRTLGALADLSGELLPTGEVVFTRNVSLMLGELVGGTSERASKIASTIDAAGVRSNNVPDIVTLEWSKFIAWTGLVILAITTRAETWKFLCDPDAALLLVRTIREMGILAKAAGVAISDRSIVPTASILNASEAEGVALVRNMSIEYRKNAPEHRMSALQDLQSHRALEIKETIGAAVEMATSLRVAMPVTENFYLLAAAIDRVEQQRRICNLEE